MIVPNLDRVTLCCVDTNHPAGGLRAIRQSMKQCRFSRSIFFTSQQVSEPGIECHVIPPFKTAEDYSRFVLKDLFPFLTTDFVLMIHWDGYVIDGLRWSDDFLKFDYIGALAMAAGSSGRQRRVFSSVARLLKLLAGSRLEVVHPEDEVICHIYRDSLEKIGILYADVATAFRFAVERGEPPGPTLGFHGLFNFWRFMPTTELGAFLDLLPASDIRSDAMAELLGKYQSLGRHAEVEEIISRRRVAEGNA